VLKVQLAGGIQSPIGHHGEDQPFQRSVVFTIGKNRFECFRDTDAVPQLIKQPCSAQVDRAEKGSRIASGGQLGKDLSSLFGDVVGEIRYQLLDGRDIDQILTTKVVNDLGLGPFGLPVIIILTELEVFHRAIGLCVCFGYPQVHCN